ncbi:Os07g0431160 [Oryza sativa Japonica Group]|uniref:Os07g0431160 protein n=1 Tax=Oryza sativa subsp. japonica TaxID=39947 RepID=A0A0P0X635_ORYSJ|nr:Os07g0431160 [Oryza sativa Japonica Group]
MEGKRTTTSMVIMWLVILSLTVDSATATQCGCCISSRAKACCFGCIAAGGSDSVCKNTCCFPCILADFCSISWTNSQLLLRWTKWEFLLRWKDKPKTTYSHCYQS